MYKSQSKNAAEDVTAFKASIFPWMSDKIAIRILCSILVAGHPEPIEVYLCQISILELTVTEFDILDG